MSKSQTLQNYNRALQKLTCLVIERLEHQLETTIVDIDRILWLQTHLFRVNTNLSAELAEFLTVPDPDEPFRGLLVVMTILPLALRLAIEQPEHYLEPLELRLAADQFPLPDALKLSAEHQLGRRFFDGVVNDVIYSLRAHIDSLGLPTSPNAQFFPTPTTLRVLQGATYFIKHIFSQIFFGYIEYMCPGESFSSDLKEQQEFTIVDSIVSEFSTKQINDLMIRESLLSFDEV